MRMQAWPFYHFLSLQGPLDVLHNLDKNMKGLSPPWTETKSIIKIIKMIMMTTTDVY